MLKIPMEKNIVAQVENVFVRRMDVPSDALEYKIYESIFLKVMT